MQMLSPHFAPLDVASLACTRLIAIGVGRSRMATGGTGAFGEREERRPPAKTLTFCPDQPRIFVGSADGTVGVWNSAGLAFERYLAPHTYAVMSMRFNHAGTFVISTDAGGNIKYFDPNLAQVEDYRGHRDPIVSIE